MMVRMRAAEAGQKLGRVMPIEPMLEVWNKRKEWPLPGSCRCVLEGPLLADSTRSRTSAYMVKSGRSESLAIAAACDDHASISQHQPAPTSIKTSDRCTTF